MFSMFNQQMAKFLESKENHEKPLHRSSIRPIVQEWTTGKPRKGKHTALRRRGGLRDTTRE